MKNTPQEHCVRFTPEIDTAHRRDPLLLSVIPHLRGRLPAAVRDTLSIDLIKDEPEQLDWNDEPVVEGSRTTLLEPNTLNIRFSGDERVRQRMIACLSGMGTVEE